MTVRTVLRTQIVYSPVRRSWGLKLLGEAGRPIIWHPDKAVIEDILDLLENQERLNQETTPATDRDGRPRD